jgi:hypothetical protein
MQPKTIKPSNAAGASGGNLTAIFSADGRGFQTEFPREEILKLREKSMFAVLINFGKPCHMYGKDWSHIVFPARITSASTVAQAGAGIPCTDELKVRQIVQFIEAKNLKVPPVGLISTAGYFSLGTIKNWDYRYEVLALFKFHKVKVLKGNRCGFALRKYHYYLDKPKKVIWEELLPTENIRVARKLLRRKSKEFDAKLGAQKRTFSKVTRGAESGLDLREIQLKVLSRIYPETIALFQSPGPADAEAIFAAYQRETLAQTGQLVGTLDVERKNELLQVAKTLQKVSRRQYPALNAVEYELVAGWRVRGYEKMTPKQRVESLKRLKLSPTSPDAVRKICERLKLPTVRKPGSPKKLASSN